MPQVILYFTKTFGRNLDGENFGVRFPNFDSFVRVNVTPIFCFAYHDVLTDGALFKKSSVQSDPRIAETSVDDTMVNSSVSSCISESFIVVHGVCYSWPTMRCFCPILAHVCDVRPLPTLLPHAPSSSNLIRHRKSERIWVLEEPNPHISEWTTEGYQRVDICLLS